MKQDEDAPFITEIELKALTERVVRRMWGHRPHGSTLRCAMWVARVIGAVMDEMHNVLLSKEKKNGGRKKGEGEAAGPVEENP